MSFFQQARNVLVNNSQFYLEQTSVVEKNGLAGLQILSHNITHGATHDSAEREPPPRCHPETRKAVVSDIIEWVNDSSRASNILWLHGPAGIGKTAIAQTVCELCQRNGQLGGSFFFSRASPGRNHGQNLVATIAYQLAIAIPQVANAIESTIANDPAILSKNMKLQFEKLIVEPLRLLYYLTATTFIIFIEGLDECEGEQIQADIAQLFGSMFEGDNLPVCLMVTSRPEPWIQHAFESTELLRNARRISLEQTAETDEDIRTVLRAGFLAICESPKHKHAMRDILKPWPSYSVIDELVGRASGQFVYATTVLKFVDDPNNRPTENLDIILAMPTGNTSTSRPLADLDQLYLQILSTSSNKDRTMSILGAVLAIQGIAQKPPYYEQVTSNIPIGPLMAAMGILGLRPTELYLALRTTHSLVNFYDLDAYASNDLLGAFSEPDDHMEYNLTFHHKSFIDFLLDPSRSGDYHVDLAKVHAHLALECLEVMNRLSFQPAPQYSGIDSDPIWSYATMHWIDHCTSSGTPRKELVDALKKFDLCFSYFDVLHRRIYSSHIHIPAAPSATVYRGSVDITRIISPRERLLKILLVPPFRGLTSIYFWRRSESYIRTYWREQYIPGSNYLRDHKSITLLIKWLKESPNPPTKLILQYEMVCKILECSIKKQRNDYYSQYGGGANLSRTRQLLRGAISFMY